jgi:hypothetical protein
MRIDCSVFAMPNGIFRMSQVPRIFISFRVMAGPWRIFTIIFPARPLAPLCDPKGSWPYGNGFSNLMAAFLIVLCATGRPPFFCLDGVQAMAAFPDRKSATFVARTPAPHCFGDLFCLGGSKSERFDLI